LIVEPGVVSARGKLFERSMGVYEDSAIDPLSRLTGAVKNTGRRLSSSSATPAQRRVQSWWGET